MKKLTVEVCDYDCYDFPRICADVAKMYGWDAGYDIREGKDDDGFQFAEVYFTMDGVQYRGEISGNEFSYCEIDGNGNLLTETVEIMDWLEACGVSTAIRAKDEDGRVCFIAES